MLVRPQLREYRTWVMDSRRWQAYRPRPGDVVVATYPKSGTTWMQQIVNLLIFQTADARPLDRQSPWLDRRLGTPLEEVVATLESQSHRRAIKSHLPLDGLPIYDEVFYIHVVRDARDVVMSFHNHLFGFKPEVVAALDAEGAADDSIARPFPRIPADPAEYFARWLREGAIAGQVDGFQTVSYFDLEKTYWDERHRANILFVNYCDLKHDLEGEMRRVAGFLGIDVDSGIWPTLVDAASFASMRRNGTALMPGVTGMFRGGEERFFNKGETGRWTGVLHDDDLALFEEKCRTMLEPACSRWLVGGFLECGDPRAM